MSGNCTFERLIEVCTEGGFRAPEGDETRDVYVKAYINWLANNLIPLERPADDGQCLINE